MGMMGLGFPSLTASGAARAKQIYEMNYVLDIDCQKYNTR